ncbi:MAG: J domain-containing protein [Bacteroidales bacterium]|nr:J domain-containing protein [Bacteroidales bacterium]
MIDYYEILEVSANAGQEVIRAAYKTLMQRYHPDKNSNDSEKAQLVLAIRLAYDVLSDPELRAAYDIELEKARIIITESSPNQNFNEDEAVSSSENSQYEWLQEVNTKSINTNNSICSIDKSSFISYSILIIIILFIGFVIYTSKMEEEKNVIAQQVQRARMETEKEAERKRVEQLDAEIKKEAERRKAETKSARTITNLGVDLTFKIPDSDYSYDNCEYEPRCNHYMKIPVLGVVVGEDSSEELISHIKKNKDVIIGDIQTKLGGTSYKIFTQVDSEKRLKTIISDQISLTVLGKKPPGLWTYPPRSQDEPQSIKGIEEILLPKSFSVH